MQIIDKCLYLSANGKNISCLTAIPAVAMSTDTFVFISDLWYKNKLQIVTDDAVFYGLLDERDPAGASFIRVTKGAAL